MRERAGWFGSLLGFPLWNFGNDRHQVVRLGANEGMCLKRQKLRPILGL